MMPRSWPRSRPASSSFSALKAWIESGVLWRSDSRRVAVTMISSSCCAEAAKGRALTTAAANADRRKDKQDMKPPEKRPQNAKDKEKLAAVFCVLQQRGTGLLAKLASEKEAARWPPLDWHAERSAPQSPP